MSNMSVLLIEMDIELSEDSKESDYEQREGESNE